MSANTSLNLVDLDFASLKTSLISYLRDQTIFRDYDFSGSNLSVLIDLLTYNTSKNVFFMNMMFSEGFLDSAQLKASVFSRAKELNYMPRSTRSAMANITVEFTASGDSQPYIIPKGSSFSTLIKSQSFIFSIPENIIVSSGNNTFTFTTDIYEGRYIQDSYVFKANIENQRFRLSNKNVDTSSLSVVVYEDGDVSGTRYNVTTTLLDLTEASKVFFLQASENGYYEILFGNGILGRQPKVNAQIVLDYRISSGPLANGAKNFSINFSPTGDTGELTDNPEITTNDIAAAGADPETLDSVRYYAPRHFQVQERAVTSSDYEILLKTQFPEIRSVSVFGGEEISPPQYGKVFVAVDIPGVVGLPDSKKLSYYTFLKRRSVLSIDPIFISPEYTYMALRSFVNYNINLTNNSAENIKTLILNEIDTFNDDYLNDFGVTFHYSKLVGILDDTDTSIISNMTDFVLYKTVSPLLTTYQSLTLNFSVPLSKTIIDDQSKHSVVSRFDSSAHTVSSTQFRFRGENCVLEDDGNGVVRVMRVDTRNLSKIVDIGTVNYDNGTVTLSNFYIDDYEGNDFKIYVRPAEKDVVIPKNTILNIIPEQTQVTANPMSV